jgi:hypothetical protein
MDIEGPLLRKFGNHTANGIVLSLLHRDETLNHEVLKDLFSTRIQMHGKQQAADGSEGVLG